MASQDILKCEKSKINDPVAYLSSTFSHPRVLLAAMDRSGSVVSGSRALNFFVPGSTSPESDWDFYVPGYKECVIDMVTALGLCGVSWESDGDALVSTIEEQGSEFVSKTRLDSIYSWVRGLPPKTAELLVGKTLHGIMETYRDVRLSFDAESYYIATTNDKLCLLPVHGPASRQQNIYSEGTARDFSILHGQVQTHCGIEKVQLIIGSYYSGIKSSMSFIKDFYASHVQCFIGGWCAGHLYYNEARERVAILWKSGRSIPVQKAIKKYAERGFRFVNSSSGRPIERHLYDESSLFIDYEEVFPGLVKQASAEMQVERRNSIKAIRWFELDGNIVSFHNTYDKLSRSSSKFTPLNDFLCLGHKHSSSYDALRTVVTSGTVYEGLRDATSWSWAL